MIPVVAIVGRTNVGKSLLFNRLTEAQKALVSSIPGTTRDRQEADCLWQGKIVRLVDTGGQDLKKKSGDHRSTEQYEKEVRLQANRAVQNAQAVIFVVDAQTGLMPDDRAIAKELKKTKKTVILAANKTEKPRERQIAENQNWLALGFGQPQPVSAIRGTGVGDLLDLLWMTLKKNGALPAEISEAVPTRVMVLGTPNVGKSSLLNAIIGEERFITGPIAHTTRQPNDTLVEIDDRSYILIDTAGIRKLAGVRKRGGLELTGVEKTLHLLPKTDVVLFVLDITAPIGGQEKHLAGRLREGPAGLIIVANKWDLIKNKTANSQQIFAQQIVEHLPFIRFVPIVFVSALTSQHIVKLFKTISQVQNERYHTVEETELEKFLQRYSRSIRPRPLRLRQTGSAPPRFELTVKSRRLEKISTPSLRFIENRLREAYGFEGTPIFLEVKS